MVNVSVMLGALGIMCAYGGYVMLTAFGRVYHAYCCVAFKIGSPRVVLSL